MASKQQMTGMRGVYLAAAELARLGYIVSPTSRSAIGADLLVTDQECKRAYSVQVKTNASTFNFWLLSEKSKTLVSPTHIYIFVNLRKDGETVEMYLVPSREVSKKMTTSKQGKSTWYSFWLKDAKRFQNKWKVFGKV